MRHAQIKMKLHNDFDSLQTKKVNEKKKPRFGWRNLVLCYLSDSTRKTYKHKQHKSNNDFEETELIFILMVRWCR